jgi:hypothetical protein
MAKTIFIPKDGPNHSGIDVTWTPSAMRLDIGGWYDSFVGLSGESMPLREFFDRLGITEAHCRKAFR